MACLPKRPHQQDTEEDSPQWTTVLVVAVGRGRDIFYHCMRTSFDSNVLCFLIWGPLVPINLS